MAVRIEAEGPRESPNVRLTYEGQDEEGPRRVSLKLTSDDALDTLQQLQKIRARLRGRDRTIHEGAVLRGT